MIIVNIVFYTSLFLLGYGTVDNSKRQIPFKAGVSLMLLLIGSYVMVYIHSL